MIERDNRPSVDDEIQTTQGNRGATTLEHEDGFHKREDSETQVGAVKVRTDKETLREAATKAGRRKQEVKYEQCKGRQGFQNEMRLNKNKEKETLSVKCLLHFSFLLHFLQSVSKKRHEKDAAPPT